MPNFERDRVRILLAGDVMTGRGIDQVLAHPSAPWLLEPCARDARDYVRLAESVNGPIAAPVASSYIWGEALAQLRRSDIHLRIVNLETAVTASDSAWPDKGINYRMQPRNIGCLTAAGIDACTLANNHVLDWGDAGLRDTLDTLHRAGLRTCGAGRDADEAWQPAEFAAAPGGRVLVFSCALESSGVPSEWAAARSRPGVALLPDASPASLERLRAAIVRHRGARDQVVVSIHWGENWGLRVPNEHREFAHALIDEGLADIVHGHSSHHPLPAEVHRGRLILYGCGDIISDYEGIATHGSLRCDVGCLYIAALGADGELDRLDVVPYRLRQFRLVATDANDRAWLERIFDGGGREFGTDLVAQADGSWQLRWSGRGARP